MLDDAVIISIQPKYFDLILDGKKTVELRKQQPKKLKTGTLVLLYVTSPVKALAGAFIVDDVKKLPPSKLWNAVKPRLGLTRTEFDQYLGESPEGVAIFFSRLWKLPIPFDLGELREELDAFIPPQSFRYVTSSERRYLVRATNSKQRRSVGDY